MLNLSALYAIVWGVFILWPWTDTFPTQPELWEPMRQIARESLWGLFFIVSGFGAFALDRYWGRGAGAAVMFGMFLSIAVLFFLGDFERPGWALIGLLALFNFAQMWANRGALWNRTRG